MLDNVQIIELKEHCVCYVVFLAINKHLCVLFLYMTFNTQNIFKKTAYFLLNSLIFIIF